MRDNFNFICHLSPREYNKLAYKMLNGDRRGDRRFRLSPFLFAVFHIVSCARLYVNFLNTRHIGKIAAEGGEAFGHCRGSSVVAYIVVYFRRCELHGVGVVGQCCVEIVVEIHVGTAEKGILAVVSHHLLNVGVVKPSDS